MASMRYCHEKKLGVIAIWCTNHGGCFIKDSMGYLHEKVFSKNLSGVGKSHKLRNLVSKDGDSTFTHLLENFTHDSRPSNFTESMFGSGLHCTGS